ncbi:MAG: cysteine synthase A [Sedimentisphaeraceae bacterium JB056]
MNGIYNDITETIGRTPLVRVNKIINSRANVLAKIEARNPLASVKDRIGLSIIDTALKDGRLTEKGMVVEATSGNTGIALAFVCAVKGIRLMLTMPESMSIERRKVLKALGAELILTPASEGMSGAVKAAEQFAESEKDSFIAGQFDNPANPLAHKLTTAKEIWASASGKADILISGVGTGGTITGITELFKSINPDFKAIAVEPAQSPVITQTLAGQTPKPGPHKIQGIGAGFIPKILRLDLLDEVVAVDQDEAIEWARMAALKEGLFVGISSGAALRAADIVARRPENKDKNIIVILPSFGERYLSTVLFDHITA